MATARRDLEALSFAGIPVYAQPGRGGGWALLGGARTDLTGLTAAETQALFLLAGPASSGSPALASALRKLVRALPSTFRTDAESAAAAVEEVEEQRSLTTATVVVQTRWLFALRGQFGRHFEVLGEQGDRTTVRLAAPTPLMIAQPLAGWGRLIEVVDSDAVRAELARLGAELVERNAVAGLA